MAIILQKFGPAGAGFTSRARGFSGWEVYSDLFATSIKPPPVLLARYSSVQVLPAVFLIYMFLWVIYCLLGLL